MKQTLFLFRGGGKDKKLVVLEHFLLVWHNIRTFAKIIR